jgi:hypothetical protein
MNEKEEGAIKETKGKMFFREFVALTSRIHDRDIANTCPKQKEMRHTKKKKKKGESHAAAKSAHSVLFYSFCFVSLMKANVHNAANILFSLLCNYKKRNRVFRV